MSAPLRLPILRGLLRAAVPTTVVPELFRVLATREHPHGDRAGSELDELERLAVLNHFLYSEKLVLMTMMSNCFMSLHPPPSRSTARSTPGFTFGLYPMEV